MSTRHNSKDKPGPRPRTGSGGLRIPSPEKLRALQTEAALHAADKVELIYHTRPQQLKIFKKDLDKLRKIGKGNYRRGFYRMLELASDIWIQHDEFIELRKIGNGNARIGLLTVIKAYRQIMLDAQDKQE